MSRARRRPTRRKPTANAQITGIGDVVKPQPNEPVHPGRRPPGRPSLLTPDVERMFLNCIRAGSYRTVCARMVGIPQDTIEKWILRGRGQIKDRPATEPFRRFVRLVEEAEAATEVTVVGNLVALSKKDHHAGLAWLRANPERRQRWPVRPDDEEPPLFPLPAPQLGPGGAQAVASLGGQTTNIDARQQIVVLTAEQVPDVVRGLLDQQREERAARIAESQHAPVLEPEYGGGRVRRLDTLRVESDDTDQLDDD